MTRILVVPRAVPQAAVRRLDPQAPETPVGVQQVAVLAVAAPVVVPRQSDPVGVRLMALQRENEDLRVEVEQLRGR